MAGHVEIRLIGETQWRSLPNNWDLSRLEALPSPEWVPLGGGGQCRMGAIAEAREVAGEEPEALADAAIRLEQELRDAR
jgi:hypothetical protein